MEMDKRRNGLTVHDNKQRDRTMTEELDLVTGGMCRLSLHSEMIKESRFHKEHKIIKSVGEGSFGRVFLAMLKRSGTYCAIKKIIIDDDTNVDEIEEEARIQNNFKHPNIVRFDASWIEEPILPGVNEFKIFYIRMEYCAHGTLRSAISNGMNHKRLWRLAKQLVHVVNYIHQKGFAHCDLKSNNVFIDKKGRVKLGDFGNAERLGSFSTDLQTIVYTGYEADLVKDDIKELAKILYEMCYGPFDTDEDLEEALEDFKQESLPPSQFRKDNFLPGDQLIRLLLNEDFNKLPKPEVKIPESEDILAESTDLFKDGCTTPAKDNAQSNAKPSFKKRSAENWTSMLKVLLYICVLIIIIYTFIYEPTALNAMLICSGIYHTMQRTREYEKTYLGIVKMVARVTKI